MGALRSVRNWQTCTQQLSADEQVILQHRGPGTILPFVVVVVANIEKNISVKLWQKCFTVSTLTSSKFPKDFLLP